MRLTKIRFNISYIVTLCTFVQNISTSIDCFKIIRIRSTIKYIFLTYPRHSSRRIANFISHASTSFHCFTIVEVTLSKWTPPHYCSIWFPTSQCVHNFIFLSFILWWIYWMLKPNVFKLNLSFFHNIIVNLLIMMDLLWIENVWIMSLLRSSRNFFIFLMRYDTIFLNGVIVVITCLLYRVHYNY
jgi:hypothetical protein